MCRVRISPINIDSRHYSLYIRLRLRLLVDMPPLWLTPVSAGALEAVHDDLETVAGYLAANEGTAAFLANPVVAEEKKKEILKKLAGEASFHAFTTNFMQLLVDKKRMSQLSAIIDEFEALFCEATDTQVATVKRVKPRKRAASP